MKVPEINISLYAGGRIFQLMQFKAPPIWAILTISIHHSPLFCRMSFRYSS